MQRSLTIDDLYRLRVPSDPALAPDGQRVVFVLSSISRERDAEESTLWLMQTLDDPAVQITRGRNDTNPRWSPDGKWIAFARRSGADGAHRIRDDLCLLPANGGEPLTLASLPPAAGPPVWSPDGSMIAFTGLSGGLADGDVGELTAAHDPVVVERLDAKADGYGLLRGARRQLFVAELLEGQGNDVRVGRVVQLTGSSLHAVDNPAWSPDGTMLAVAASVAEDLAVDTTTAIFVIDASDLERQVSPRRVGPLNGVAGPVVFDSQGDAVVTIGRTDTAVGHSRLLWVPLREGEIVDLAPELDRNVMGGPPYGGPLPQLSDDGSAIVFGARDRGCTHVYRVSLDGSEPLAKIVGGYERSVSDLVVAPRERLMLAVVATPYTTGELVAVGDDERVLTAFARDVVDDVRVFAPQERVVTSPDGRPVHAFVLHADEQSTPGPLLLDIHGGPHNAWGPTLDRVHLYQQELVARGWTVVRVNPRGSDGYGESFYREVVGAWGRGDMDDFLAAIDALVEEKLVDPGRIGVTGYSYGGYMACWLSVRTHRFAAAIAGGCICDLRSMVGTADGGYILATKELGGTSWENERALAASSPLTYGGEAATPTLLIHGEDDLVCPIGQAEQWFALLKARGVPTRLVRYPNGTHMFFMEGRPSHRVHVARETVAWLDRHVPASPELNAARV